MKRKQDKCSSARTLQDFQNDMRKIEAEKGLIHADDVRRALKGVDAYLEMSSTATNPLTVNLRLATNPEEAERLLREKRENAELGQKRRQWSSRGGKRRKKTRDALWKDAQKWADEIWNAQREQHMNDFTPLSCSKVASRLRNKYGSLRKFSVNTIRQRIKKPPQ